MSYFIYIYNIYNMTITYSYETSTMTNLNGKKNKETKSIVDGDKGVTIYFLRKTDSDFKKVKVIEKEGVFNVMVKKGEGEGNEQTQELDEKEFLKMAKGDDDLDFAVTYMKKRLRGGAKRSVKKGSKKMSKKMGGSKKAGSKKVVKTRARKAGSKKVSKK